MCVEAHFLNDNRVILYKYSDPLDLVKDAAVLAEHRHFYAQSKHRIHRIVDGTQVTQFPDGFLSAILHTTNLRQPNSGIIVVIINQAFLRIIAEVVSRALRSVDIHVVNSMSDAMAEIERVLAQEDRAAVATHV